MTKDEVKLLKEKYWFIEDAYECNDSIVLEIDKYIMEGCITNSMSFSKDDKDFMYDTLESLFGNIKELHVKIKKQQ